MTPLEWFERADVLVFRDVRARLSTWAGSGWVGGRPGCIAKTAGATFFELPVGAFGLPIDLVLRFDATMDTDPAYLRLAIDQRVDAWYGPAHVTRVRGQILAAVLPAEPGPLAICDGSLRFRQADLLLASGVIELDTSVGVATISDLFCDWTYLGEPLAPLSAGLSLSLPFETDGCGRRFQVVDHTQRAQATLSLVSFNGRPTIGPFAWSVVGPVRVGWERDNAVGLTFVGEGPFEVRCSVVVSDTSGASLEVRSTADGVVHSEQVVEVLRLGCRLYGQRPRLLSREVVGDALIGPEKQRGPFRWIDPLWDPPKELAATSVEALRHELADARAFAKLAAERVAALEGLVRERSVEPTPKSGAKRRSKKPPLE